MSDPDEGSWLCALCDLPLEMGKAQIHYLGSLFTVELLRCPKCGKAMVHEEMATGKMAEAEQVLEDK